MAAETSFPIDFQVSRDLNLTDVHIVLAGPYPPDRQHSMERYAQLLKDGLAREGIQASLHTPGIIFGRFSKFTARLRKPLTYLDKFVLFPRRLARKVRQLQSSGPVLLHILDQGNALYLRAPSAAPVLVTCHDLIAAKAALLPPTGQRSGQRSLGHWFHSQVVQTLQCSQAVICDSDKTLSDCQALFDANSPMPQLRKVHVPLDPFFCEPVRTETSSTPFLLHVGNSAWYKNRTGLLRIYGELCTLNAGVPPLHLYGEPLQEHELAVVKELQLHSRVVSHSRPTNDAIRLAYHGATALIFPSLQEGFGWPPLEAMACGCPVFTSNRAPLTEVGGSAAEYIDPENPASAAAEIARCLNLGPVWRDEKVRAGKLRAAQFTSAAFMREMILSYQSLLGQTQAQEP